MDEIKNKNNIFTIIDMFTLFWQEFIYIFDNGLILM